PPPGSSSRFSWRFSVRSLSYAGSLPLFHPRQNGLRVPVRREDRIEHLRNPPFLGDEREALDQPHAVEDEGRKPQRIRQPELLVAQDLVGQPCALNQLALVLRVLAAHAEDGRSE